MAKNKTTAQPAPAPAPTSNRTLTFRREHPGNWVSFGIAGMPGRVAFKKQLFANGVVPKTITVDCALAVPVVKAAKVAAVTP